MPVLAAPVQIHGITDGTNSVGLQIMWQGTKNPVNQVCPWKLPVTPGRWSGLPKSADFSASSFCLVQP